MVFDLGETLLDFNLADRWHEHLKNEVIPDMIAVLGSHISSGAHRGAHPSLEPDSLHSLFYQKIARPPDKLQSMKSRIDEILRALSLTFTDSLKKELIAVFRNSLENYVSIYPDVVDTLQILREESHILGLWSNTPWQSPGEISLYFMQKFHIAHYFAYMFFSGDFEVRKPDPRTMEIVLENSGQNKEDMVYIGNSEVDIITGVNFNIPMVWINRENTPLPSSCPSPTFEIKSLTELPEMLRKLEK